MNFKFKRGYIVFILMLSILLLLSHNDFNSITGSVVEEVYNFRLPELTNESTITTSSTSSSVLDVVDSSLSTIWEKTFIEEGFSPQAGAVPGIIIDSVNDSNYELSILI